ncbi:MAG: hypothetical protein RL748_4066 [Pseudomonadota bacterium]
MRYQGRVASESTLVCNWAAGHRLSRMGRRSSHAMSKAMQGKEMTHLLKYLWLLGALLALLVSLIAYDGKPNSDVDLLLGYVMLTLSLPSGLIAASAFSLIGQIVYATTGYIFTTSYELIVVTWLIFLITGYVQWFVFLPWLWRKWKARRIL